MKDIGRKAKIGLLWNTGISFAGTWLQFVSVLFLARLLMPRDFGIVACGMMVIGFATKFGDFGFKMGLIQRKQKVTEKHVNTMFTMDLTFKVALWLIIWWATPRLAIFLNVSSLNQALPFISFYIVLECFSTTPLTMMQRKLDFKNYSLILMYERIFTTIFQIIMALVGFGFWSLIYGKLVGVSLIAFMAARKMSWWPKLHYDHEAAKELFSFGFMVFLRNFFRYGAENVDYFWVAKFLGEGALGLYERAFTLMKLPQKIITKSVNSVAFSAFSRIQDQPEKIRLAFRKLVLGTSLLSFPILTGLAFIAPLFIPIVLGGGDKWLPIVIPLQIMCTAGIIYSIASYLNTVLTATGLVKYVVVRKLLEFILVAITAFYGVQYGINGVALAILIVSVIVMLIIMVIITRKTVITWADYFVPQFPSIITSAGMLGAMCGTTFLLTTYLQLPDFVMLCVQICIGFVSYIGLHLIFRFKLVTAFLDELSKDTKGFGGKMIKKVKKMKSNIYAFSNVKSIT